MYRTIPSTDRCVKAMLKADARLADLPGSLLADLANTFWNRKREEIRKGECSERLELEFQLPELLLFAQKALRPALRTVLNATGVIIHTNLGRSILAAEACAAINQAAGAYCNLEMDLDTGTRGSRHTLINGLLRKLTGAEDAIVVNNNAAAVLLVLDSLCAGGETIVSRGELVEIGGSFRIPDIMEKSGSRLKEVGTTNRTHLADYQKAINENTRAIMRVHASNFRISGFHSTPALKDLKKLAHEHGLPLLFDLGSGSLLDLSAYGLPPEPTVQNVLAQGADIVCFSGDKALGGPQAGIIAGKAMFVEKIRRNPLMRALRCDKLCLAALEATLRLYLDPGRAKREVPTIAMLACPPAELAKNASALAAIIRKTFKASNISCKIEKRKSSSRSGGGSFPESDLPTTLLCLKPENMSAQKLRDRLLQTDPPLVGRLEKDSFCLDPRTLAKKDYPAVAAALANALENGISNNSPE